MNSLSRETKQLRRLKLRERFRIPRTGNICLVLNRYSASRIEVFNETKQKKAMFKGNFFIIPIA